LLGKTTYRVTRQERGERGGSGWEAEAGEARRITADPKLLFFIGLLMPEYFLTGCFVPPL
jgi:hypothetical protein